MEDIYLRDHDDLCNGFKRGWWGHVHPWGQWGLWQDCRGEKPQTRPRPDPTLRHCLLTKDIFSISHSALETSISGRRLRLSVFLNYLRRLADKFPAPPVIAIDCPVDVGPRMQQLLEGKETARSSLSHLAIDHTLNRLNHTSTHEHPRRHRLQTHYYHWPAHPSWHWQLIHHQVLLHRFASWHSCTM